MYNRTVQTILFDWPFVGLGIAAILLSWLFLKPYPQGYATRFRDPAWLLWLVTPMYMIHQFEEYGRDLLGQRFHFLTSLCATLGHSTLDTCPADPAFVLAVNIPLIWVAGPICAVLGPRRAMAAAVLYGVPLINALAHLRPLLTTGHYNSGVFTSVVLFLPVCGWVLYQLFKQGILDAKRLVFIACAGVVLHAVLFVSLQLRQRGIIGQPLLLLIQVLNGMLPVFCGFLIPALQTGQPSGKMDRAQTS